ncbi:hypothetical protein PanWU01x14_016470 [Parasponia andersonii]|uniref:Uncharacterized protein n=1 Tax=Parasponia andersonii TaxID=3476 RepID=A0A2P5DZM7_PARAD|nr:hypothetical protein PanWU01x14_016470 [Parasponia andersonii]
MVIDIGIVNVGKSSGDGDMVAGTRRLRFGLHDIDDYTVSSCGMRETARELRTILDIDDVLDNFLMHS